MTRRIRNLEDLLETVAVNPDLARSIKEDPQGVAGLLGVQISDQEAAAITENLDMDRVLRAAEAADSMAAKVAQGIGLEPYRGDAG